MPLREDLLNAIPGDNPSGQNLYYAPVYDKLKEARREEEDIAQGDWQRARKVADWPLVIKLAGEALATQSKDLQLAAWLVEAHLNKEGLTVFAPSLNLLRDLVEAFWDTLYPELEDGDAEMRATPLEWIGNYFDKIIRRSGVTKSGFDTFKYKEALTIGYEADAQSNEKAEARQTAITEGKLTAEDFDKSFDATSKEWYEQRLMECDASIEALESLQITCESRFADAAPGYSKLRTALEEVRQTFNILLNRKLEKEPDAAAEPAAEPEHDAEAESYAAAGEAVQPVRRAGPKAKRSLTEEPADKDDAADRIAAVARYLRREDPYSPAAYMLVRGLRFGELRAAGDSPGYELLAAPPTEVRQELKRLANEGQWQEVLDNAEAAAALPCGRAWLDVHRYSARACSELGYYYDPIANSIKSMLRALLADYPQFLGWTLADDTPTANAETITWLREQVLSSAETAVASDTASHYQAEPEPAPVFRAREPMHEAEDGVIDAWQLAMEQMQRGNKREALEILSREITQESSGRGRFHRKVQLARVCMDCKFEAVARPILEGLAGEIESRKLESWEPADDLAQPLVLLYQSFTKAERESSAGKDLYARICRLDPMQAMSVSTR
jgi:type VI secretion system protein ImpA